VPRFTLYLDLDVGFAEGNDVKAETTVKAFLAAVDELANKLPAVEVQFHEAELRRGSRGKVLLARGSDGG
jgi:hypothetical protein